jgi:hypothetical protein
MNRKVIYYKEIFCPLLNRETDQVYCDWVLDYVYYKLGDSLRLHDKIDDVMKAESICHVCENREMARVAVRGRIEDEHGNALSDFFPVDKHGNSIAI